MSESFLSTRFCTHCGDDLFHDVIIPDGAHQGSADSFEVCIVCGWWKTGISGTYHPPPCPSGDDRDKGKPWLTSEGINTFLGTRRFRGKQR